MKRLSLIVSFCMVAFAAFASEELDIYTNLYHGAVSAGERLSILQSVSESNIDGAGQLYAEALSQLLREQPTLRGTADTAAANSLARLLSGLLGSAKYMGAAGDLWRVVQNFSDPLVKADALVALGRLRSPDYFDQVVKTLNDLNVASTGDPEEGGKIAYGAILALEKYQKPEGYLPVFFASTGWYNRRIRDQAAASLPYIIADPSAPLSSIIMSSSYDYDVKLLALQKEEASKANDQSKAGVAVQALAQGWLAATRDVKQQVILANTRKLAIDMLMRYKASDAAAVPLLIKSYREGIDLEEKLGAVAALSSIGSDDSAAALSSFLMDLNMKRQSGNITQDDERIVRTVIPALGATGKPNGRTALRLVQNIDWTNAVKVLAADALKKLQ